MLYMHCDSYDVSVLETFRFCLSATLKHSLVFKRLSFDDVDDVGVHKIRNQKNGFLSWPKCTLNFVFYWHIQNIILFNDHRAVSQLTGREISFV